MCMECPAGWFQDQNLEPSLTCKVCPSGYGAVKASDGISLVAGSALCLNLNYITSCASSEQYLNDTSQNPAQHACEQCPPGGACGDPSAKWSTLAPLFGWWKIPRAERGGNASWKPSPPSSKSGSSTAAFAECLYAPACLGAPNRALERRYFSEDGVDLAMVGLGNASSSSSPSSSRSSTTCSTSLGFRNQSRLCHACNATSRRESNNRCTKCPDAQQNWGLIVLGFFVALLVLCFLVGGAIADAGKQTLSSAVQKILLNYMQVAALATAFPLRWPPALQSLFEFQGAVSTVGESLINPDCVTTSSSAADLFYHKQAGFAAMPFIAVIVAFVFWYVYGCVKKTPFFRKRGERRASPTASTAAANAAAVDAAAAATVDASAAAAAVNPAAANAAERALIFEFG